MLINASLPPPPSCSWNTSSYPNTFQCFSYTSSSLIFIVFTFTNVFVLLPLYVRVLWLGHRQWRRQRLVSSGTTSHTDVFTYNMVVVEIIGVLGSILFCCGKYTCNSIVMNCAYLMYTFAYPAQTFFHCLTCVERYVAVVHPIAYLGLGNASRLRFRNISIGCVWLNCCCMLVLTACLYPVFPSCAYISVVFITVLIVSWSSFAALRSMFRLGLEKVSGGRKQIDQAKLRAFRSILVITAALLLRSVGTVICNVIFSIYEGNASDKCVALLFGFWLCVPSCLVLPLQFLHRVGALLRPSCDADKH